MINQLTIGDNLPLLQGMPDESVDLIYIDPPFNTKRDFGSFDDRWSMDRITKAEWDAYHALDNDDLHDFIKLVDRAQGESASAFLMFMAIRLIELHRILKSTGSIYLHCDTNCNHYLRMLMDDVFGEKHFGNEIIWMRTKGSKNSSHHFGRNHDVILRYIKSHDAVFNQEYLPLTGTAEAAYAKEDEGGRYQAVRLTSSSSAKQYDYDGVTAAWLYNRDGMDRLKAEGRLVQTKPGRLFRRKMYLHESKGVPVDSLWTDIANVGQSKERTGYPTQKPVKLLERIIKASSNPGDIVLDCFAGSGTTLIAAERLGRDWIGIDINPDAKAVFEQRLSDAKC